MLGFGVHEGDWEFAQVALDADGAPTAATYAQHGDGERCGWNQVQKTSTGAPVIYVALASHASYFKAGVTSRGLLPADNHRGGGYRVRPQLEVVTPSTPFMAWRGRWGGSSSSPIAPRRQGSWIDPAGFESSADVCSVSAGGAASPGRRSPPCPRRAPSPSRGLDVVVAYRFRGGSGPSRSWSARRVWASPMSRRPGALRSTPAAERSASLLGDGPLVIEASTFSRRGMRSAVTRVQLR